MAANKIDARQSSLAAAQAMLGSAASDTLDTIFPKINNELAKLFEDRNVLITDGGIITFTGTQIQFTENLNLVINQKISGAAPQVFNLGQTAVTLANNEMLWAILNRTAGTATLAQGTTMPAVNSTNQEVFLLVKRVDAGDGTQRIYWRNGSAFNAGQSARLGSAGSGSGGSGIGDDLNALLYRASFRDGFEEGTTDSKSAVDATAGRTDPNTYSAAKALFQLSFDASKTIAAGTTTTNINLSAVASFTVKIGDIVINNGQARRITAVASQSSFTVAAFSVAPTLASQVTVSQAVYTKDIYNLPVDGNALSAEFSGQTFSDILVDYEDTSTVGDAIFDVNVAPVIAFDASNDNTNFTSVQNRPTLGTTTISSTILPSAGTALYLRFFALKTSGSGSVNVLGYRAFMQKALNAGTAGGITNSAYAFTNGVGTPINTTVSVVGGKTTLTLNWQYAVGVYAGTTASSVEVWLNGQKLPRFVNSTLTPDGSFLESSANVITLDRDYSSQNLSVEVFQRTQIVDNSTINTTNISYQQEVMQNGFQAFVAQNQVMNATSITGTPVAGTFYSTIVGRAPIVDFSQDLKVRMGIEQIMTQSIYQLQNEFGPNGEPVSATPNDLFGQIRFVGGSWANAVSNNGQGANVSTAGDYVEVTFYGTGLNLLQYTDGTARGFSYKVDGGSTITGSYPSSGSGTIQGRLYNSNTILPVVSGLSLGTHTVQITLTGASVPYFGFQILTETSSLRVSPGVSYINGQKEVLSSLQSISYNSGFESGTLGTRGGRVVVYQKADGTIAKAVQPTNSSIGNLASADHSNEEIVRVYNFREFGAGRWSATYSSQDDFSQLTATARSAGFTLDDGTTTLVGSSVRVNTGGSPEGIYQNANGDFVTFTFVGTGLDVQVTDSATGGSDTFTFQVDGATAVNWPYTAGISGRRQSIKIASGLPYGTHTVRFNRVSAATWIPYLNSFTVYQPKKPSIPSGAIELADYNVMADYSTTSTASVLSTPPGTLRKSGLRETVLVGTWNIIPNADASFANGFNLVSAATGSYAEHTFYGTGFEYVYWQTTASVTNYTITVDGSTNLSGFTSSLVQNGTGPVYTASTGTVVGTPNTISYGNRLRVSGLSLGLHKVRITYNNASNHYHDGLEIITPIHSQKSNIYADLQNTLPVGSQGISDNRKLTPVKDIAVLAKNCSQAYGVNSSPTTSSTTYIPLPDMSVAHSNKSGKIKVTFNGSFRLTGAAGGQDLLVRIFVNGVGLDVANKVTTPGSNYAFQTCDSRIINCPLGVNKIDIYWLVTSGSVTAETTNRQLIVEEL